ncbi:MAG: tRNA pseudouridine(55) synthase TruB [Chlamydiia bacterium]|nr:tRNA pseudouridine(55) synthase TruB [Chlamydiia bacterium]
MNREYNQGLLLIDKAAGFTSFQIVSLLRRITREKTIGHAGTLDPFATGVMVMLIGREFTKRSNEFLSSDKQYHATVHLGVETSTYDIDGQILGTSPQIPSLAQIEMALAEFQGAIFQTPPMYSAKKVAGQKLYDLARRGITIERAPVQVTLSVQLLDYTYPHLTLLIDCSKGTYIRSLAHDLGKNLGCGAHLSALIRTKSGSFSLDDCVSQHLLTEPAFDITPFMRVTFP